MAALKKSLATPSVAVYNHWYTLTTLAPGSFSSVCFVGSASARSQLPAPRQRHDQRPRKELSSPTRNRIGASCTRLRRNNCSTPGQVVCAGRCARSDDRCALEAGVTLCGHVEAKLRFGDGEACGVGGRGADNLSTPAHSVWPRRCARCDDRCALEAGVTLCGHVEALCDAELRFGDGEEACGVGGRGADNLSTPAQAVWPGRCARMGYSCAPVADVSVAADAHVETQFNEVLRCNEGFRRVDLSQVWCIWSTRFF